MIRILMLGLLAYIGYRIIVSIFSEKKHSDKKQSVSDNAATTHRDPICGIYVSEEDAVIGRLHGERYYFCSHDCLDKFREKLEHT